MAIRPLGLGRAHRRTRHPLSGDVVLTVEGLGVAFDASPTAARVIDGVSFSVRRGRTLCLVGESGCGKTVTALAIMGLLARPPARVTAGRILFGGHDLLALTPAALRDLRGRRLSMVFQEPLSALNPVFTIGRQLTEVIRRHRPVGRDEAAAQARLMLERVRIPEPGRRMAQYPHELSGGMRQRVMVALALANGPELLLADEPTTALDVTIQAQVLRLIKTLQEETGTAMLLITHDLGVVAEVADDVAVMYAGKLVETAPVRSLFADPHHPYTLGLMSAVPQLEGARRRLASIAGSVPAAQRLPPGCRFSTRCPFADDRCRQHDPPPVELTPGHGVACWKAPLEMKLPTTGPAA